MWVNQLFYLGVLEQLLFTCLPYGFVGSHEASSHEKQIIFIVSSVFLHHNNVYT
jgi:hypothetical protein